MSNKILGEIQVSLKKRFLSATIAVGITTLSWSAFAAINSINVAGNQLVGTGVILSYLNISAGQNPSSADIDKAIKSLYDTGLFQDVSVTRSGNSLNVKVVENPVVNRVAFEGNRKVKDAQLQEIAKMQPGSVFNRARIQEDVRRIVSAYESSGYSAASVTPKQIQRSNGRVDLVYVIDENRGYGKEGIRAIVFNGNRAFSDLALRNEIRSTQSRWYNFMSKDDIYDPDRVAFDVELLKRLYLKNGYADVDVRSAVAERSARNGGYTLTYTLYEGARYRFGNITYRIGVSTLGAEELKGALSFRSGNWFNIEKVEKTAEEIRKRAAANGYPFLEVRPDLRRSRETNTVDVAFVITEGPANYVERVDVVGNTRTHDSVIRRQMHLDEGDALNKDQLLVSERRIKGLGYFDRVDIGVVPGSTPDQSVVRVSVREKSTASLNFGASYSTDSGVAGTVSYTERNLFGRGQILSAGLDLGGEHQNANLSFTEPYFTGRPIAAGFDLYYRARDYQDESSFDSLRYGGSLRFGYRLNEYLTQSFRYTLERDEIENVPDTASVFVQAAEGKRTKSSVSHTLTFDTRDSRYDTRRGILLSMTNEYAGLGGDVEYFKNTARASFWQPIYRNVIFTATARGGHVAATGSEENVHLFDRFSLGQPYVRGFSSRGIDNRDVSTKDALGGNWFIATTAQVNFPIPSPKDIGLTGHVFMDAGKIGENDDMPNNAIVGSDDWRYSVGAGITWASPMGPLSVSYAKPIEKVDDLDKEERIYFSMGAQF